MSFKFIHAADLHLDSPLKGLERYEGAPVEEIRGATRKALENLVSLALDEKVDFVVISGDIYDGTWKDFNTGLFFVDQMTLLRRENIPVVAIHGNHDAENRMTRSLKLRDSVRMLSTKKPETVYANEVGLPQLDVAFHGQGFATSVVSENVVPTYPAADPHCYNIGLLHTSLTGDSGHPTYAPCTLQDLRDKGYDYWALGHIHKRNSGLFSDPAIVFPGNIQGRHIRETGAKGCVLVCVDGNHKTISIDFQALDVMRWEHCEVSAGGATHPEDLLTKFTANLNEKMQEHAGLPLAVRVSLTGPCAAHRALVADRDRWANEIRLAATDISGGSVWVEKIQLQTSLPRLVDERARSEGPLGEVLLMLAEWRNDEAARNVLAAELVDLQKKLPPELSDEPDWKQLDDPQRLQDALAEVEALLLVRLGAQEEAV